MNTKELLKKYQEGQIVKYELLKELEWRHELLQKILDREEI